MARRHRLSRRGSPITQWPASGEPLRDLELDAVVVESPGDGTFVEVVGESYCQSVLEQASGGRSHDGPVKPDDHVAILIPEPTNRADKNAVRVFLREGRAGYLSRDDAVRYRPVIDALALRGQVLGCWAQITGGWDRGDGDTGSFGLRLFLGSPESVMTQIGMAAPSSSRDDQNPGPPAGWYPDPTSRHQYRYWDGSAWSAHVADDGVVGSDPLTGSS